MNVSSPAPPRATPSPSIAATFERWLAEREERNTGIVPPWLDPNKAWPPCKPGARRKDPA